MSTLILLLVPSNGPVVIGWSYQPRMQSIRASTVLAKVVRGLISSDFASSIHPSMKVLALSALVVLVAGCATKKYVKSEVGATEERAAERIEVMQSQIENAEIKLAEHDEQLEGLSNTAREALDRAIAAGKLAEGKFLFERVLSDDLVRFGFDEAGLSGEAKSALDGVAADLISEGGDVYVEVQGHTDSVGTEDYNLALGHMIVEDVNN